jgi:hypothetical protein
MQSCSVWSWDASYVGSARTVNIQRIYGVFGRKTTRYSVCRVYMVMATLVIRHATWQGNH